jgi:hypothetical protein
MITLHKNKKASSFSGRLVGGLALVVCLLTSCYKIVRTMAPKLAEAGSTIEVSFTVVDDGSDVQNFVTDWSYAGIRVPDGWEVTVPRGAHQQFAEDWVYYSDGSKVNSKHDMVACSKLADFYNAACKKTGYRWHGFQSQKKVPKNISACWRNGCDSIRITFLVTIPQDAKPGNYTIDFIGGDEEDDAGIDKYGSYTEAKDSRLFHVGTVNNSYIENKATALACQIEVRENETGIGTASNSQQPNANSSRGIYTLDGKQVRTTKNTAGLPHGVYYVDGKKTIVR